MYHRMRLKQNRFPVLFLTNGITNKWTPYLDLRCRNTQISTMFAKTECLNVNFIFIYNLIILKSCQLKGVVLHAEELLKNTNIKDHLSIQRPRNFLTYCWGQDLNNIENREKLKDLFADVSPHGFIYDRVSEANYVLISLLLKHDFNHNFDPNYDSVYITGSIEPLGNWNIQNAVKLKIEHDTHNANKGFLWWTLIDNHDKDFEYKFFIAREPSIKENSCLLLKQIELNNRKFKNVTGFHSKCSNEWRIDPESPLELQPVVNGWLQQNQFELQFNFFNNPLKLFSAINDGKSSIKITPYVWLDNGKFEIFKDFIFDFTVSIL
jgi:hypothetical protein